MQDIVIVGSGYGAAMAAHTWAGCTGAKEEPLRMVLLERGRERLPGSFPSTLDELPGDVRISRAGQSPIGRRDALLDLRLAGDVSALVGNGLGGGSLINAGVMAKPTFGGFDSRLPPGVEASLEAAWLDKAKILLGGQAGGQDNTVARHPDVQANGPLLKTLALQQFDHPSAPFQHAPITVRMRQTDNQGHAVPLADCTLCGDCLTGCNVGAKVSLDTHLLVQAQHAGLRMFTSASVLRLKRQAGLWSLEVVHTDPQVQDRRAQPVFIQARKVVLAAGSLGSTEILLRSHRHRLRRKGLALSPRLGEQFSLNGDNMASITCPQAVNTVGDESLPLAGPQGGASPRRVGPEITGMLSWPADTSGPGFLAQELSVPAPLRGFFQEIVTTRQWAGRLVQWDATPHRRASPGQRDPLAIDREAMERELLVGLIGHDSATGRVVLPSEGRGAVIEGSVRVDWPGVNQDPAMADAFLKLERRVQEKWGARVKVTPNPLWRLLPKALDGVIGGTPGGALTTHPLGGCPMGATADLGVVNEWGAVYQVVDETNHPVDDNWQGTLLVLDGAIVPASLGANPALTIAALSLRAAGHWRTCWGWAAPANHAAAPVERPRARALADCLPAQPPAPTQFQIIERLWGQVDGLKGPLARDRYVVELSFAFEPSTTDQLTQPLHKRLRLEVGPVNHWVAASRLRIFRWCDWVEHALDLASEGERESRAQVSAPLQGHMDLLERLPSRAVWRALRAALAYGRNRGGRDLLKWWRSRPARTSNKEPRLFSLSHSLCALLRHVRDMASLANHAGETRAFLYQATISDPIRYANPEHSDHWRRHLLNVEIQGDKRFAYACRENPWSQLLHLKLRFLGRGLLPRWWWPLGRPAFSLKLDARFLAGQGAPLLRITQQASQVRALADLSHLGMYWSRLFLKLNHWHLRAPDPPTEARPQRLPGTVKGLPVPEITEIDLEPMPTDARLRWRRAVVRLTRYRGQPLAAKAAKPPLIFIHGYSASGTTFAHDAIEHHAAGHFWRSGRDIWILDLRTSAGMATAREPWAFEDVAWADIPVAIEHIAELVGRERGATGPVQVDVFAHCIGAVMLSTALLAVPDPGSIRPDLPKRYPDALNHLGQHIHKMVLSQKGFYVQYTDANILRSYLINFMKSALAGGYSFRPPPLPRQRDQLFDAFLNALPYPESEGVQEHPWFSRVPWSSTRRRMDALYERTFNLQRMPREVLERIDDFFGPLNLKTVSQVIHLARRGQITLSDGRLVNLDQLVSWPKAGTLFLSADGNGMVHPNTGERMASLFQQQGIAHRLLRVPGGHQDILIGRGAQRLWCNVGAFLDD